MRHRPKPLLRAGGLHSSEPAKSSPKLRRPAVLSRRSGPLPHHRDYSAGLSQGPRGHQLWRSSKRPSHLIFLLIDVRQNYKFNVLSVSSS